MLAVALGLVGGALYAVVFGDAATAAGIGMVGTMLNTILTSILLRRQAHTRAAVEQTQRILRAPRQLVFDAHNKPVGTILRLNDGDDVLHTYQRADDPPPPA